MRRRHSSKKDGGLSISVRCLLFWLAPLAFLYVHLLSGRDGQQRGEELSSALLPGLLLLVVISTGSFLADLYFRCSRSLAVAQISIQFLLMLWQADAMVMVSAPAQRELVAAQGSAVPSVPVLSAASLAQEVMPARAQELLAAEVPVAAPAKSGQLPLLARSRRGATATSGQGSEESAEELEFKKEPDSMSIVLPCLNESTTVIKTVNRFCERTPKELLKEIIVVDDGSKPPLETILRTVISDECRLRVLRHEKPWGLMIAKQTGGDAALGKYVGFYDCHVAPGKDWWKETVKLLGEKTRRLVVPLITDLSLDTFDERTNSAATAKCYINFNADFWWYDDESDNIPVISGGLVATTRSWWQSSGGFDPGMRGWGGENTDQSLRTWLCGGDIVRAKTSRIAHMWRVTDDPRTTARYRFPGQTDNLARVAAIWFDEFAPKFRQGKDLSSIDVTQARGVRKQLKCQPFIHFLHRFRKIYVDGGVIPDLVFKIRQKGTGNCITRSGGSGYQVSSCSGASKFHLANMIPKHFPPISATGVLMTGETPGEEPGGEVTCGAHKAPSCAGCPQGHGESWCHNDCEWRFGSCVRPGSSKKKSERKMGSGIREWNSLDCFDAMQDHGPLPYQCDLSGNNQNQKYVWDASGHIKWLSGDCVDVGERRKLKKSPCEDAATWERIDEEVPLEATLYKDGVASHGLTEDMPDH